MNSEERKEYNKRYYESKKNDIKKKLFKKVECELCKRVISHQNISKHKKSSYCIARSNKTNEQVELSTLQQNINELKKKIEDLESKSI